MSIWIAVAGVGVLAVLFVLVLVVMWAVQEWATRDRRNDLDERWVGDLGDGSRLAAQQDADLRATLDSAYGPTVRRALALIDRVHPSADALARIRGRLGPLRLVTLLAAITTPRREAEMPHNVRRPLELRPDHDVIVARPPGPRHPELDGQPGRWSVTAVDRVYDHVTVDAVTPDGADWRFVLNTTDRIQIETPAMETTR